jgi:peptide/nickel transport system ATP-binding protein/oligopeptide transport system ATP-binding protein
MPAAPGAPLLEITNLTVDLPGAGGAVRVIDGVSLSVAESRTLGLIGESGSGKTMTALAVIGLLPPGAVTGGTLRLSGEDLLTASAERRRAVRGHEIGMVFQDSMSSLNPVERVGKQVGEILRRSGASRAQARAAAVELLARVEIADPERRVDLYPHEMSGGMRQRVMIAMALAGKPRLILADEPTTALDVTVRGRVLDLLARLRAEERLSVVLVSHDLRVIAHTADDVTVMYAGRVAESGPAREVLDRPAHPYTAELRRNVPRVRGRSPLREPLRGAPPTPERRPSGCPFHPRCPLARARCAVDVPVPRVVAPGRTTACHYAEEVWG